MSLFFFLLRVWASPPTRGGRYDPGYRCSSQQVGNRTLAFGETFLIADARYLAIHVQYMLTNAPFIMHAQNVLVGTAPGIYLK